MELEIVMFVTGDKIFVVKNCENQPKFRKLNCEKCLKINVFLMYLSGRVRRQLIIDVSIDHRGKNVELAPIYFSKKNF